MQLECSTANLSYLDDKESLTDDIGLNFRAKLAKVASAKCNLDFRRFQTILWIRYGVKYFKFYKT